MVVSTHKWEEAETGFSFAVIFSKENEQMGTDCLDHLYDRLPKGCTLTVKQDQRGNMTIKVTLFESPESGISAIGDIYTIIKDFYQNL